MSSLYTTKQGDRLDVICFLHYGKQQGVLEQVLDANEQTGLVMKGLVFDSGVVLILPDLPDTTQIQIRSRWRLAGA